MMEDSASSCYQQRRFIKCWLPAMTIVPSVLIYCKSHTFCPVAFMGISKFRHLIPSSILPYLTELKWQAGYGVNIIWTPVGTPVYMPTRNCVPAYIVSDGNDHCLCRKWYKTGKPMLQCEKCGHWYHLQCAGVAADEADSVDFICHICTAP